MNYNIGVYIVFLVLMAYIIVFVGRYFYTNGRVFILSLLKGNEALTDGLNKSLLVAYYLFNMGYAFLKLKQWPRLVSFEQALSSLARNAGLLVLLLALLHYGNILVIYLLSKSNSITHKSIRHE